MNGTRLLEDFRAITPALHHSLEPFDLPAHSCQPGQQFALASVVGVLGKNRVCLMSLHMRQ